MHCRYVLRLTVGCRSCDASWRGTPKKKKTSGRILTRILLRHHKVGLCDFFSSKIAHEKIETARHHKVRPKRNIFRVLIQFNVSLVKNNALLFKNMVCFGIWTGSSGLLACTVVKDLHTHRPCSVPSASRSLKVLFAATPSSGSRRFRTSIQEEERYDQFWAAFFASYRI